MNLIERLRQMSKFYASHMATEGERFVTTADEMAEAADRIDKLEIALHRIVGHGNITVDQAKEIAAEAVHETQP